MGKGKKMAFTPELLERLLVDHEKLADMVGPDGLVDQLRKALAERPWRPSCNST
jgi:hypothetical protein